MWWALHQAVAISGNTLADTGTTLGATSLDGGLARLFVVTLLGLLGIGVCWALLLMVARWVMARLSGAGDFGEREPAVDWGAGRGGLAQAGHEREEPSFGRGRLRHDAAPAPAAAAGAAPGVEAQEPSKTGETHPPADHALPIRHVQLARLPQPQPLGAVKNARPEWTGAVVPTSLEEAGAVEVTRVPIRHPTAAKGRDSVRAIDYRISALPRVDAAGQRRPNMLVYTALDRGSAPKASTAPLRRKT